MCGRFLLGIPEEIVQRFEIKDLDLNVDELVPRFNIAPSQSIPVITRNAKGDNHLGYMKWGLVPFWAEDEKIGYKMINARAETLENKPMWKKLFANKRCIIPATGFYEWDKKGKEKVPYYFKLNDRELFGFAGLWDTWKSEEGELVNTFTIITTVANSDVKKIHDRMPVILDKNDEDEWLNPEVQDIGRLKAMLHPYSPAKMEMREISTAVNSPQNDSIEILNSQ
jgi:putative SOS response-associated peptidase YedK